MAFTVIQDPTNPNAAYTRLLTVVSGSIHDQKPQFQYVCDFYESGSSTFIKRMTQPINPAGTATFDVSRIAQGELSADYNWKINTLTQFNSSSKEFVIKMGEQFGTSISSSVTVYPDQDIQQLTLFQGVVDPNAGAYNFSEVVDSQVLSNMPSTMSMQSDDFGTISVYNDQGTSISQSFYGPDDISGGIALVDQKNYFTDRTYFNAVPISSSANYWNYVDVSISSSFGTENYRYEASDETHREKTRFAFVNKLGAWDYYNNYNPVRQAFNITREQYTAPRVDYSSRTSLYDISRRGLKDYHNSTDDIFTVDTDLLDKTNANWLEELIESPEVYIQRNGEFIPIVITDSSYTSNTNQARQKGFKYTINFKPSNQPYGKWIPEYVQCPRTTGNECGFLVNTEGASGVTTGSMALTGSVTSSAFNQVQEVGFVYSTTTSNPTIPTSANQKVTGLSIPISTTSFSLDTGNIFNPNTLVYYRAYGSSSLSTCPIVYGSVQAQSTLEAGLTPFDPTLGSTLEPLMWYDFSDTGSMHMTGSDIFGISSKGEYTGSLVRGNTSINNKYISSRWTAPQFISETSPGNVNKLQYAYFNGNGDYGQYADERHSSLAQLYNSGTLNDYGYEEKGGNGPDNFAFFNTQQNWTHITIFKPNNFSSGSVGIPSDYPGVVAYNQNNTVGFANIDQPSQYNINSMWNNPTATSGSFYSDTMDWMSTTESFASSSYTMFTRQEHCVPAADTTTSHSNAMYSYEGASGPPGWITAVGRQTRTGGGGGSGNSTLELMREPGETVLTYTGSGIANEVFCDYYGGQNNDFENLVIGSNAQNNINFGANFYMGHFLLYSQSLSDTQITNIINSYKSSSFEPVNAISN